MTSDGVKLRDSWAQSLHAAQSRFRSLLVSSSSPSWKQVAIKLPNGTPVLAEPPSSIKGKARAARRNSAPDLADVVVHRKSSKDGDIYRAVLETVDDNTVDLDVWKAVLSTPEMRKEWDPSVQDARIIEMFDPGTRITKTDFSLGWPANPRDAITISKSFTDSTTLIDISTSLPRSLNEPAYLRPAPPFVRSHIHLFAWCIQLIQSNAETSSRPSPTRLRITCFWQHDLKAAWGLQLGNTIRDSLPSLVLGLLKTVRTRGSTVPLLSGYGQGVALNHLDFEAGRQLLTLEYTITDDEDNVSSPQTEIDGMNDLVQLRERRRLDRSVEVALPGSFEGWDVRITARSSSASSDDPSNSSWTVHANHSPASLSITKHFTSDDFLPPIILRISHSQPSEHCILKVILAVEHSAGSKILRVNGTQKSVGIIEPRNPSSFNHKHVRQQSMLEDASAVTALSHQTQSTTETIMTSSSGHTLRTLAVAAPVPGPPRTPAVEKAIQSLIRRNYIYFTSLLQEPDAKWSNAITEARGVTVTRLNSIDPTLVVYKAEAVFVGLSVWDLLATISTPGAGVYYHKGHDDSFIEHVTQLTELWHLKTKAAWPMNTRDNVILKTSYKSPTALHVFSFSVDDTSLFPSIPSPDPGTIRTQIDLQGWAIEALSPSTTLLTLIDQSDAKGWSNKSSIPSQMISTIAGLGEFTIKCGGPPFPTRIAGARIVNSRYDHERSVFRIDYQASSQPAPLTPTKGLLPEAIPEVVEKTPTVTPLELPSEASSSSPSSTAIEEAPTPLLASRIECELRCDIDIWGGLDLVIDPPAESVSCLRRHKLSSGGGGLWITVEHDPATLTDERLTIVVRKAASGKEKGVVTVNGGRAKVDVEELPEHEVKALSRKKRVKPARIPLDQPPVLTVLRRRNAEYEEDTDSEPSSAAQTFFGSMGRMVSVAMEQVATSTFIAATALAPNTRALSSVRPTNDARSPVVYAYDAVAHIRRLYEQPLSDWIMVTDKGDVPSYKRLDSRISPDIEIHRGWRVLEGFFAEDVAQAIFYTGCRRQWDPHFESEVILDQYGSGSSTAFRIQRGAFPFRDRGYFVATAMSRLSSSSEALARSHSRSSSIAAKADASLPILSSTTPTTIIIATASYSLTTPPPYSSLKVNPQDLPVGNMLIEGWMLETLDPYGDLSHAIPSTKCSYFVATDLGGSAPLSYTAMTNARRPRENILALETYLRNTTTAPLPLLPGSAVLLPESAVGAHETDATSRSWNLDAQDSQRTLITSAYQSDGKIFRATITIHPNEIETAVKVPPLSSPGHRSGSPRPSTTGPGDGASSDSSPNSDLIACEVIVDPTLYPSGYQVEVASKLLPEGAPALLELSPAPLEYTVHQEIQLTSVVYAIPPPAFASASPSASRHLLRLILPVTQHTTSAVHDPLSGVAHQPVKPKWLLEFERRGGLLDVVIKPRADGKKDAERPMVNGSSISVVPAIEDYEKLGRDRSPFWAVLDSVPQSERRVLAPIASSSYLFDTEAIASTDKGKASTEEGSIDAAVPEGLEPAQLNVPTPTISRQPSATGLLGFLSLYSPNNASPGAIASSTWATYGPSAMTPTKWFPQRFIQQQDEKNPVSTTTITHSSVGNESSSSTVAPSSSSSSLASRWTFSLSAVIVIAIIAFLLGSLSRSLISPADYIYMSSSSGSVAGAAGELDSIGSPSSSSEWRQVKRLVQFRQFHGWDIVLALIRRPVHPPHPPPHPYP